MTGIVFLNNRFIPEEEATVSVNDRGFMFADGTYDVMRSIHGILFHGDEHFQRLEYCLKELEIQQVNLEEIRKNIYSLLKLNNLQSEQASVYIQITRGVYPRTHTFPEHEIRPTIYLSVKKFIPYSKEFLTGVKCITSEDIRWQRCDLKTIGLTANIMAVEKAKRAGAYETIFIRNGLVTEATHSSVFGVLNGIVMTHPKNNHILAGISRDIVIDLCKKNNIPVEEKAIESKQLKYLDELMVVGTSTEIMPVIKLDDFIIGNGKPGPISRLLHASFRNYMKAYVDERMQKI